MKRISKNHDIYNKTLQSIIRDSIRIRLPKSVIPELTHFFRHVTDAMGGDDRPDHGLAIMRKNREYYRMPFLILRHALARSEKKLTGAQRRRGSTLLHKLMESEKAWDEEFRNRPR